MLSFNLKKTEAQILDFWAKNKIYEKAKALRKGKKPFSFIDGPPYATGSIHMGTAWNKILKDLYIRFWRMQGFDVSDQPGYDCHGLPTELKVEQQLNFHSKKDIERFGIANFIKECRKWATKYIDVMSSQFANLGVWMDWKNPYLTLKNDYIEGAWYTFKKAAEQGFLYKDVYPVHVCSRCETALAYNEIEYTSLTDPSIWIKFPIKGKKGEFLLIWTTTPWTIPSNTGIMVHPDFDYARVQLASETLIIAKDLLHQVMQRIKGEYKIIGTIKGKDLEGMEYEHPLKNLVPALQNLKNAHRVVLSARYVHLQEGTGLVHTAPGHGWEDWLVSKDSKLPLVSPVNLNGTFNESAGEWLKGKYVKAADKEIIAKLRERNALLHEETVTHDYPQCWRCDTPLLQISIPEWFFKVENIRERLIKENERVSWTPSWAKQRFRNWLENLGDWPVSRQRYWGIPLPIWECPCGGREVIGSFEELKKKAQLKKEIDFHKPAIDAVKIKCPKCRKPMKRVPDILDVWFDSGVCSWASLGYPRKKELFKKLWPPDFQTEGPDQIRGWWNSEAIMSMFSFNRLPFKNILYHGFILDLHGVKMSKSRGNIVTPEQVVNKYSRDVLRLYLLASAPWEDFTWNWEDVSDVNKIFTVWWNCAQFIETYVENKNVKKPAKLNLEDKWILSKLNSLLLAGEAFAKSYNMHKFVQSARDFILNDFSRTYIKLIRDRVAVGYSGKDRSAAEWTLLYVLNEINKALAPVTPFITESIHQQLFKKERESVHLCSWPKADKKIIDKSLENQMDSAREIIEVIGAARASANLKLRWPVAAVTISTKDKNAVDAVKKLKGIIKQAGNVKDVRLAKSGKGVKKSFSKGELFLDTTQSKELLEEAMIRELIRQVQMMRKEAKKKVTERINLCLKGQEEVLKRWIKEIEKGTTSKITLGQIKGKKKGKLKFEEKIIQIGF